MFVTLVYADIAGYSVCQNIKLFITSKTVCWLLPKSLNGASNIAFDSDSDDDAIIYENEDSCDEYSDVSSHSEATDSDSDSYLMFRWYAATCNSSAMLSFRCAARLRLPKRTIQWRTCSYFLTRMWPMSSAPRPTDKMNRHWQELHIDDSHVLDTRDTQRWNSSMMMIKGGNRLPVRVSEGEKVLTRRKTQRPGKQRLGRTVVIFKTTKCRSICHIPLATSSCWKMPDCKLVLRPQTAHVDRLVWSL